MDFEALDFLTGILTALLAVKLYVLAACRRSLGRLLVNRLKGHSNKPVMRQLAMQPLTVSPDWIKSGTPVFKICEYGASPDKRSASGTWSCEGPATFEWHYDADDSIMVLEGRAEIDYLGQHFVLEAGDSATFYAGTQALWNVQKYVHKTYMLHQPNYQVRWSRRLLGAFGA
jgi:uncharacterized cupin superfamily protein